MDNIILCPLCNGKENGCEYCEKVGYVIKEGDAYFSIKLGDDDQPQKSHYIGQPKISENLNQPIQSKNSFFIKAEPHDIIWFFKDKLKNNPL